MSLSEKVVPLLSARAATDPDAAKLLEMFTKAEKMLNESSTARIGDPKCRSSSPLPMVAVRRDTMATELCQKCKQAHPGRLCDYDDKGDCAETVASTKTPNPPPSNSREKEVSN